MALTKDITDKIREEAESLYPYPSHLPIIPDGIKWSREAYIKGRTEGAEKDQWIPVSERRPEESGQVLVCLKDTLDQYIAFYKRNRNSFEIWGAGRDPILDMKVTHWQPLPEPPKS